MFGSKIKAIVDDVSILSREVKFVMSNTIPTCSKLQLINSPPSNKIVDFYFHYLFYMLY